MALKPLHDRVLVRRVESDEKTSGGLIIPESAKDCLLYTSPSPRDMRRSRMPSSA